MNQAGFVLSAAEITCILSPKLLSPTVSKAQIRGLGLASVQDKILIDNTQVLLDSSVGDRGSGLVWAEFKIFWISRSARRVTCFGKGTLSDLVSGINE
jgi:hypothetical protein